MWAIIKVRTASGPGVCLCALSFLYQLTRLLLVMGIRLHLIASHSASKRHSFALSATTLVSSKASLTHTLSLFPVPTFCEGLTLLLSPLFCKAVTR
jgi:hypothetical protein